MHSCMHRSLTLYYCKINFHFSFLKLVIFIFIPNAINNMNVINLLFSRKGGCLSLISVYLKIFHYEILVNEKNLLLFSSLSSLFKLVL
jgi:hypothetical protein